jgi:hypothetical protein
MSARDATDDRDYFAHRAHEELVKATTCENNAAARIHLDMANGYRRRADELSRSNVRQI